MTARIDIRCILAMMLAMVLLGGGTVRTLVAAPKADGKKAESEKDAEKNGEKADGKKKAVEASKKDGKNVKEVKLASIMVRGSLPEGPTQAGLFGELEPNLAKTIARLDKVAEDDDVAGVVLRIRSLGVGLGRVNELRAAIGRVRKADKTVVAQLESGTTVDYLLASSCDKIVMPEAGMLLMPGLRMEMVYFKDLLDKLGLQADFFQVGAFKGAAEPFTRSNMSAEVRYNRTALVDDMYDQIVSTIAKDRSLDEDEVEKLIDRGLFVAREAKKVGLIDEIAYENEMREVLAKQMDAEVTVVKNYGTKKVDADFSGPMGLVKMMQMMMGIPETKGGDKTKQVAVVYASGPITSGKSESGLMGGTSMGSDTIVAALRQATEDDRVVAVVLRVDSPGGSALASDLIWRETVEMKKPLVVSMGNMAASGGYYISMGADKIFAEPGTITGSIGVVGGKIALGGLLEKIGVTTDVISRGKNSGMFSSTEKFSASERKLMEGFMQDIYGQFTAKAAKGRKMPLQKLQDLAGGQIYTGRQAKKNGLVDEVGTLEDAIAAAKKMAGIKEKTKVKIKVLPEPKSFFDQLFERDQEEAALTRAATRLTVVAGTLSRSLSDVEVLERVFRERAATILPMRIVIE